jgi:hypothetical protein
MRVCSSFTVRFSLLVNLSRSIDMKLERQRLVLSVYFILAIFCACRIGPYGSESEWGDEALRNRKLAITRNDLIAD